MTTPSRASRVHGCLVGGAVGDALGWPVEFLRWPEIRARYGPGGIAGFDERAPGGRGAVTDDTQMTLFTAEGLLRASAGASGTDFLADVPGAVRRAYLRWLRTQGATCDDADAWRAARDEDAPDGLLGMRALHAVRAPGATCLAALRAGGTGTRARPVNDSKGCGGVMRVAPVALHGGVPDDAVFALAATVAALTHGHPSGWLSAGAHAEILRRLVRGATLDAALDGAMARLAREPAHEETTRALAAARALAATGAAPSPAGVGTLGGGWVGEEALAIGVYAALVAPGDVPRALRVAVNHSGDSDSTGSIAGQLLGARLGLDAVPAAWREGVELADVLAQTADALVAEWPGG
jgi:ADP-ribosylglycohydrolase